MDVISNCCSFQPFEQQYLFKIQPKNANDHNNIEKS
jgi:hypothetical protein